MKYIAPIFPHHHAESTRFINVSMASWEGHYTMNRFIRKQSADFDKRFSRPLYRINIKPKVLIQKENSHAG